MQRGSALLIGLLLLAAMSLLALVSASGMMMQRHMSANFQQETLARDDASIANAFALAWLYSRPVSEREAHCEADCLLPAGIQNGGGLPDQPEFLGPSWWRENALAAGLHPETAESLDIHHAGSEPPRWIIEEIHYEATGDEAGDTTGEGIAWYRVLSRGTGPHPNSIAVTESIAARPWDGGFRVPAFPPDDSGWDFCAQFPEGYDCGTLAWRQRR